MSLSELAGKCGTDKLSHGYISVYESVLSQYKNDSFNFLEVGVFFGSSINMWREYFKNATIYGADSFEGKQGNGTVFPNADRFYNEWNNNRSMFSNVELVKLDQSDEEQLKSFVKYCNDKNIKFKVILDDGSHLMKDQQITFFYLFDLLEEGGIYIIEDTHTCGEEGYDVFPDGSNSTKLVFETLSQGYKSIYVKDETKGKDIASQIKDWNNYIIKRGSETMVINKV